MPHRSHMDELFQQSEDGYCLCEIVRDHLGKPINYWFVETNTLFEEMTSLPNAAGRTARDLMPDIDEIWYETFGRAAEGETLRFNNESTRLGRFFEMFAIPTKPYGRFVIIIRDITDHRRSELDREEARRRAENLLVELNHRVMNTLAMITSIVRMESHEADEVTAPAALRRLETRLATVTVLYRALNRAADVGQIAAERYLTEVANAVAGSVSDNERLRVVCDCEPEQLPSALAAPLGLLVNELMTNALKHAFPYGRTGCISIRLYRLNGQQVALDVRDDGIGSLAKPTSDMSSTGIGTHLVEAFVEQIDGKLTLTRTTAGTCASIVFPLAEAAPEAE